MYSNYQMYPNYNYQNQGHPTTMSNQSNDDRLIGGFAFPFLLGGVTGAALAPNFWGPRPYPRPYPYPVYPVYPYPSYPGYPVPIR